MSTPIFTVQVLHLDGAAEIALRGELDLSSSATIETDLLPLAGRYDAGQITLDCSQLRFVDVWGLGQLLRVAAVAGEGGRICLRAAPRLLREMLRLTGTADRFEQASDGTPLSQQPEAHRWMGYAPDVTDGFAALCSCGWQSERQPSAGLAGSLADRHRADAHGEAAVAPSADSIG